MPVIVRFTRSIRHGLKCPPSASEHGVLIDNGAIKLIDVRVHRPYSRAFPVFLFYIIYTLPRYPPPELRNIATRVYILVV